MTTLKQIYFASVLVCSLLVTAAAQDSSTAQRSSLTITATAVDDRVRITAPSSVVQMHVEVYAASGEKLFDQEIRGGNVFDWHLQNDQAQRLAPGSYVCVVTVKSISGKLTQRIGSVSIEEKSVSVQAADSRQLSAAQAQPIGPVEENSSWTIPEKDEPQTPTVIAHDGTDGQMIRGRGALTFRIGNFFSGLDTEQMRLTEAGNLGIGTSEPKAKLEVAGTIRAERFLVVKPGQTSNTTDDPAQTADDAGSVQPLVAGTGTQNQIAKWIDNSATLGNSGITETATGVGIATAAPTQALDVNGRIVTTGSKTLTVTSDSMLEVKSTITNNGVGQSAIKARNIFNGSGDFVTGLDVAPTFAPSQSLSTAQGFVAAAFFAPPPGVTITNANGGSSATVYSNTTGAVTNGAAFNVVSPFVFGALKPTNQYGLRINNQGIAGTANSYGLFVDPQSGSTNSFSAIFAGGNVGIGTTVPAARLHVAGTSNSPANPIAIVESAGLQVPLSFRSGADETARIRSNSLGDLIFATLNGSDKDIFFRAGDDSGTDMFIESATGNVGIGTTSPAAKLEVDNGSVLSSGSNGGRFTTNNPNNSAAAAHFDWFNDTARIRFGGSGAGATNGFVIQGQGDATKLTVTNTGAVIAGGKLFFFDETFNPPDAAPPQDLCGRQIGPSNAPWQITLCSSSIRYKTDVRGFTPGLDLASRLRPVSFRWKGSGSADLGLVAEEVERVDPLLATYNKQGQVEGVKYDRIGVILLNAVREQQAQIKVQQQQLHAKDERIANLAARLARYESSLSRYESRLASLERSVASDKRTKRQVTISANSTRQPKLRRAALSKAE